MAEALIGCTGFVGATLLKQHPFDFLYRSTDIDDIACREFDLVVCAGMPARKWIANREPEADYGKLEQLTKNIKTIKCGTFVLISTVDVFRNPVGVTEKTSVEQHGLHPYGLHRHLLEKVVEDQFPRHLIVRLPGLVGPGLRKNVIFDFLNNNNLHVIDSRGIFQFYPIVNLWYDMQKALAAGLKLVHLTAEPISVGEVSSEGFGRVFDQRLPEAPVTYDLRSVHAERFGGAGHYQYSKRETVQAIRAYAQSKEITVKGPAGVSS